MTPLHRKIRALLVASEDAELRATLERAAVEVHAIDRPDVAAVGELTTSTFDVVVLNLVRWDEDGRNALQAVHRLAPTLPIVVTTPTDDDDLALDIVQAGAHDCLPIRESAMLPRAIRYAVERNRVEQTLVEERARLDAIVTTAMDAIIAVDAEQHIVLCNPAASTMFQRPESAMLGHSLDELLPPRHRIAHRVQVEKFGETNATRRHPGNLGTIVGLRATGEEFPIEASISRGRVAGRTLYTAIIRDISERIAAERRLRDSEERFRQMAENIAEAVCVANADWSKVLYLSPAYTKITGQPCDTVLADPAAFFALVHPDDRDRVGKAYRAETLPNIEYRIVRPDGSVRSVWARCSRMGGSESNHIVGVLEDITERKKLEQQFLQAQKMQAIGSLAGGVAHDFNNLLTIINGNSHLLFAGLPPESEGAEIAREISEAGRRAESLTRQLLLFSRKQIVAPKLLDLNAIIADMSKMLKRLIGENVDLKTSLMPSLQPIQADPGQIEQVLMNIVVNAGDAMPRGGSLTIETSNLEIRDGYSEPTLKPGRYVRVSISDTGVGMDAATVARVFEPFFTTKPIGKGTGLGLATVYAIVTNSGGHVTIYSEPGMGTTMRIYLPAAGGRVSGMHVQAVPARGSETVLLVEDEPSLRTLTRRILQSYGYVVLDADNGEKALRVAKEHQGSIHLLITDVVMPVMGGRELAEQVQSSRPEMRVLYVSGYTDDVVIRNGVLSAETPFLQKPFTPDSLLAKVRDVLDADIHHGRVVSTPTR